MDRARALISLYSMPLITVPAVPAEYIKCIYLVLPYPTYPLVDSHPYFPVLL